jgi:hypothetical protein
VQQKELYSIPFNFESFQFIKDNFKDGKEFVERFYKAGLLQLSYVVDSMLLHNCKDVLCTMHKLMNIYFVNITRYETWQLLTQLRL